MKLLEYQAKELFDRYGIVTPKGIVLSGKEGAAEAAEAAGLSYPLVVKAQVQVGGRGKAGGVRFAYTPQELRDIVDTLLFSRLKGMPVNQLLAVEKADVKREWYLSILLDREAYAPSIIFSPEGGIEIEETARVHPEAIIRISVNPLTGITDYAVRYLISKSKIDSRYEPELKKLLVSLYQLFVEKDCLLAEINPVAVASDGSLSAIDGKVDIDDSALYRQTDIAAYRGSLQEPELVQTARSFRFLYIPVAGEGRVAVMSNGSGMLMSMIDLLSKENVAVSCALDLGGGATRDRILEAVRIVLSTPGVDMLFICIFGGITRCDEVAEGVRLALEADTKFGAKTIVIRMEGTNKDAGLEIVKRTRGAVSVGGIVEGVKTIARMCLSPLEGNV